MRVVSDGILRRVNVEPRIRIMIATGSHRAPTDREIDTLVGEELHRRIAVFSHDCQNNNVYLGTTRGRLPVHVDRIAAEASFIITTGLIAPTRPQASPEAAKALSLGWPAWRP